MDRSIPCKCARYHFIIIVRVQHCFRSVLVTSMHLVALKISSCRQNQNQHKTSLSSMQLLQTNFDSIFEFCACAGRSCTCADFAAAQVCALGQSLSVVYCTFTRSRNPCQGTGGQGPGCVQQQEVRRSRRITT